MKYKTILITGGAGFIGSNLAVAFKKRYRDLNIICLDNLKRRGSELNLALLREYNVRFIHADIRCPEDLMLDKKIDLLIECSAEPSVLAGYENPAYIINTNLNGTVNCLELCRKHRADIIFLSTSRVYPYEAINVIKAKELSSRFEWVSGQNIPGWSNNGFSEGFTTNGAKTFYGATKLASELMMREFMANYGIKGVINRCGVIAGPGQFGKVDQGIFTFWMLAHYFKKNVKYIGFSGKGKQVRDVLHVNDLFELLDLQIKDMAKLSGQIFNVGGGRHSNLSLVEATRICHKISGNRIKIAKDLKNRPGDINIYITDNKKVTQATGWKPRSCPVEILEDIFEWIGKNEALITRSIL